MGNCNQGLIKLNPAILFLILILMNFLIYLDRGAISGVLDQIVDDLNLNTIEGGALGSTFMLGYMIASPLSAHLSQFTHPFKLIIIGMTVWVISVSLSGFSKNFWILLFFRSMTGSGEAAMVSLAPPIIFDIAPSELKSVWLAIFFSALFLGIAGGYIFSTLISQALGGWEYPFFIQGILMIPFVVLILFAYKDPSHLVRRRENEEEEGEITPFKEQIKQLLLNPIWIFLVLGLSAYTYTGGALGYWGPYFLQQLHDLSSQSSAIWLGTLTISSGLSATLIGSFLLDKTTQKYTQYFQDGYISSEELQSKRTERAFAILVFSITAGLISGLVGLFMENLVLFLIGIGLTEFFLFLGTGPIGMALMESVSKELRGQSNAISVFMIHLLGDFPSPLLTGLYIYYIGVFGGIMISFLWLVWCVVFWGVGWNSSRFKKMTWKKMFNMICRRKKSKSKE